MSIATNNLSETSRAAAWPEFLRSAGSPRARAHLLTRIQKAHRAGNWRQLRYLTQQYLTSYDARLAATRLASRKMRWDRRPKKTQLRSIAENLNANISSYRSSMPSANCILGSLRPVEGCLPPSPKSPRR